MFTFLKFYALSILILEFIFGLIILLFSKDDRKNYSTLLSLIITFPIFIYILFSDVGGGY